MQDGDPKCRVRSEVPAAGSISLWWRSKCRHCGGLTALRCDATLPAKRRRAAATWRKARTHNSRETMRMKIAIVGVGGRSGSRIAAEAVKRGHQVTAIGPTAKRLSRIGAAAVGTGSLASPNLLAGVLASHDVVVSTARFVQYQPDDLIDAVAKSQVHRLVVVGGAGSLRTAGGGLLSESRTFPKPRSPKQRRASACSSAFVGRRP